VSSAWSTRARPFDGFPNGSFVRLLARDTETAARFPVDPRSVEQMSALAQAVRSRNFERAQLVEALTRFNRQCGADELALDNVRALGDPNSLVVATGQQPVLAGGPLLVLLKAATAVAAARLWSGQLGCRVIPVFWIASDDHDLAEMESVARFDAACRELRRHRVSLAPYGPPAADLLVGENVIEEVRGFFDPSEPAPGQDPDGSAVYLARSGEFWTSWIGRALAWMTRGTGLVLLDPSEVSEITAPHLLREIANPRRTPEALRRARNENPSDSAQPALRHDIPSSVFLTHRGRRQRFDPSLHNASDIAAARQTSRSGISGDAALRTIVQSAILPVIAVVGGPGELAYWSLLREAFEVHQLAMPAFLPRARGAVIVPQVAKQITKLSLPESEWLDSENTATAKARATTHSDSPAWAALSQDVLDSFHVLQSKLDALGGNVPARSKQAREALERSLSRLLEVAAARVQESSSGEDVRRLAIARTLAPFGRPQDTVLSSLTTCVRFDEHCFAYLATMIDPLAAQFLWIEMTPKESD
jgi:bacillithiol synthase